MTPWGIEEARHGVGPDTEELQERWAYIVDLNEGVEPELHPLNRRALRLYPIIINRALADVPGMVYLVDRYVGFGEAEEWEEGYLIEAVGQIYGVTAAIQEEEARRKAGDK